MELNNIFFEVFPKLSENEFGWGKEQKDYENWDSFAQLNIITFAESKFDISFSLDESIEITDYDFRGSIEEVGTSLWFNACDIRWQYTLRCIIINYL